jgi:DNA-binding XRE family transcriptional regulator
MTNNTFALKMARCAKLCLTQERMAQVLGVSLRNYCRWEKSGAPERVMRHVALLVESRKNSIDTAIHVDV